MPQNHFATYVHDHVAGSVGALELMQSLAEKYQNTPVGNFVASLRYEVKAEREALEKIAQAFPLPTGIPRRVAAWVAEKGFEMKLALDGASADSFQLFEGLEAISVGIAGKKLLWCTLFQESKYYDSLLGLPYERLIEMSERQRLMLEPYRLAAARKAFLPDSLAATGEFGTERAPSQA